MSLTPSLRRTARRHRTTRRRRGAAAVEFALIAPLMLLFTFGMIESARLMMVKNAAVQATREGARMAVLPSATEAGVRKRVMEELSLMSVEAATIELEPEILANAEPGADILVRVRIAPEQVSWLPSILTLAVPEIAATSVMRRESTD
ncbi:TadE/TadG family type IV pilus assembly protein [Candidatus Laterigemmans baculatus]|uniref:TadE/TadG family type IV pilus assembly protein n=1 Tax=Candidatus Laterigemmans baculatus TaxID=2770505 RepID=UPI0013DC6889|nr:TadE family protein [Candidatus Laterigemmans baculatus]